MAPHRQRVDLALPCGFLNGPGSQQHAPPQRFKLLVLGRLLVGVVSLALALAALAVLKETYGRDLDFVET